MRAGRAAPLLVGRAGVRVLPLGANSGKCPDVGRYGVFFNEALDFPPSS
jgi:hypothetical protein